MKSLPALTVLCTCILLLSGCKSSIHDFIKNSFNQGQATEKVEVPKEYLKTVILYDQFTTIGSFTALWLSNDVKRAYCQAQAVKFDKNEERKQAMLRRQLEENHHFISFYLLISAPLTLGEPTSKWAVSLLIDDKVFTPTEIKNVELDMIYQIFFGLYFNRFKSVYRLKFDARDEQGDCLMNDTTKTMALRFRCHGKTTELTWNLAELSNPYSCVSSPEKTASNDQTDNTKEQPVQIDTKPVNQPAPAITEAPARVGSPSTKSDIQEDVQQHDLDLQNETIPFDDVSESDSFDIESDLS